MTTYTGDEFKGATFERADLTGATFRYSDLNHVTMRSIDCDGLDIDSHDLAMFTVLVNGVDVVPLTLSTSTTTTDGRISKWLVRADARLAAGPGSLTCTTPGEIGKWMIAWGDGSVRVGCIRTMTTGQQWEWHAQP